MNQSAANPDSRSQASQSASTKIQVWLSFLIFGASAYVNPGFASPTWPGNDILIAANEQLSDGGWSSPQVPRLVTQGKNGAFVLWVETQEKTSIDILAQRLGPTGELIRGQRVTPVSQSPGIQYARAAVNDGHGGMFVAWDDQRNPSSVYSSRLFVQRFNSAGLPMWERAGVEVASPVDSTPGRPPRFFSDMIEDGQGGIIISWIALYQSGPSRGFHRFIQKIDAKGTLLWGPDGIEAYGLGGLRLASDGEGGAVTVWTERGRGILAKRISAKGQILWGDNGSVVSPASDGVYQLRMVADGKGGEIIAWLGRHPNAQRIDSDGLRLWGETGISIPSCWYNPITVDSPPQVLFMVPDGAGGCVVAWKGCDDLPNPRGIYAQRLNSSGTGLWTSGGIPICESPKDRSVVTCLSDGAGGAVLMLLERQAQQSLLLAQHVASNGTRVSGPDGIQIAEATGFSALEGTGLVLGTDLLASWAVVNVGRPALAPGLFAKRVALDTKNERGRPSETGITADSKFEKPGVITFGLSGLDPNPASGAFRIGFSLPTGSPAKLEMFSVSGRRILEREVGSLGPGNHGISLQGIDVQPGVYLMRISQAGKTLTKKGVITN